MADLPTTARVVIIGGGVVGASSLYHLALRGWTDCVLTIILATMRTRSSRARNVPMNGLPVVNHNADPGFMNPLITSVMK